MEFFQLEPPENAWRAEMVGRWLTKLARPISAEVIATVEWRIEQVAVACQAKTMFWSLLGTGESMDVSVLTSQSALASMTIPEMLNNWRMRMCKTFGDVVVAAVLNLLFVAPEGLQPTELVDLLSMDDEVLKQVYTNRSLYPTSPRIPAAVWVPLRKDLTPMLQKQPQGSWSQMNGELAALVAEDMTKNGIMETHASLADYWSGR